MTRSRSQTASPGLPARWEVRTAAQARRGVEGVKRGVFRRRPTQPPVQHDVVHVQERIGDGHEIISASATRWSKVC